MAKYVCSNCNKGFNRKANYMRHLNRTNPCKKHNYIGNINNENHTLSEEELKCHESDFKKKKKKIIILNTINVLIVIHYLKKKDI